MSIQTTSIFKRLNILQNPNSIASVWILYYNLTPSPSPMRGHALSDIWRMWSAALCVECLKPSSGINWIVKIHENCYPTNNDFTVDQSFQYFSSVSVLHYLQVVLSIKIWTIFMNILYNIKYLFRPVKVSGTTPYWKTWADFD